jgi:hypothetical protein
VKWEEGEFEVWTTLVEDFTNDITGGELFVMPAVSKTDFCGFPATSGSVWDENRENGRDDCSSLNRRAEWHSICPFYASFSITHT